MINKELIITDELYSSKNEVFQNVSSRALKNSLISNSEIFISSLEERESILSTAVGHGIAIPHCQSISVKKPFISLIRPKCPILWGEAEMVDVAILIAIPQKNDSNLHLKTIAKISKKLVDDEFLLKLREGSDQEIFDLLDSIL